MLQAMDTQNDLPHPRKPFLQACWDTIVYSFTAEVTAPHDNCTDDDDSFVDQTDIGCYERLRKTVLDQFQTIDLRSMDRKKHFDKYIVTICEKEKTTATLTFGTVPPKPLPNTTSRFGIVHPTAGFDYFSNRLNAFMNYFGSCEDNNASRLNVLANRKRIRRLSHSGASSWMANPMLPSKAFLIKFYFDAVLSPYTSLCPNTDQQPVKKLFGQADENIPRKKMRFELPQRERLASVKPQFIHNQSSLCTVSIARFWQHIIHTQDPIQVNRKKLESYLVDKFLARMVYFVEVVSFLRKETHGLGFFHHPIFLVMVMLLIFLFLLVIEIHTLAFWIDMHKKEHINHGVKLAYIIAIMVTLQIVILRISFKEFNSLVILYYAKTKGLRMALQNIHFTNMSDKKQKAMKAIPAISLMIVTVLLCLDMAKSKDAASIFVGLLLIFLAFIFSKNRKLIPWVTIICLFSSSYILMTIWNAIWQWHLFDFLSSDFAELLKNSTNILADLFNSSQPSFIFSAFNIMLFIYFCLETAIYFELYSFFFMLVKPITKLLALTWIEVSYAIAAGSLTYRQLIHLNSNMLRLMTDSELCLFFTLIFSSCSMVWASCYFVLGVPFQAYVLLNIVHLPSAIAFSKILWPESQKSRTAHRGLLTRHPPVVSFTQLLSHVWIGSIGGSLRLLGTELIITLSLKTICDLIIYVINLLIIRNIPTMERIISLSGSPLIWICGATLKEALRIGDILVSRIIISNLYSSIQYSLSLSMTWFNDCKNVTNVLPYGNIAEWFRSFKTQPLSHHSLFITLPYMMPQGSFGAAILVTAEVCSITRDRDIKRIVRISLRSFYIALLASFFTSILISNVIGTSGDSKMECISEYISRQQNQPFCKYYFQLAQKRLERYQRESKSNLTGGFINSMLDACFSLYPKNG